MTTTAASPTPSPAASPALAARSLTVTLEPESGVIHRFYAFLDGVRVIAADGGSPATYQGTIADHAALKVRMWGVDRAEYSLNIDLPGTANDQSMTLSLIEGYHELELTI